MGLRVFKETTKWSTPTPNHTYILSEDKQWLHGYVKQGQPASTVKMFKNRIRFDARNRTFKEIK